MKLPYVMPKKLILFNQILLFVTNTKITTLCHGGTSWLYGENTQSIYFRTAQKEARVIFTKMVHWADS